MVSEQRDRTPVLDHGYVALVESWGSDERIVEAARMSTDKGFQGWGPKECPSCHGGSAKPIEYKGEMRTIRCNTCDGIGTVSGDERLLRYLYTHKHMTPFEMAGMTVEVQAPIFVFREWHRHRTQSYNELSARYTPLPDVNYRPDVAVIVERMVNAGSNKQAQSVDSKTVSASVDLWELIGDWLQAVDAAYTGVEQTYQTGLALGIPKELARIVVPVGRYSRMRASANLRNWLGFLTLRMDENAQWEIRQYAHVVGTLIAQAFPRTWKLFEGTLK